MPKKSNFKEDLRIERKNIFVITDFSIITANVNIFRSSFIKNCETHYSRERQKFSNKDLEIGIR